MCTSKTVNFKYNVGDRVFYVGDTGRIITGKVFKRTFEEYDSDHFISYEVPAEEGPIRLRKFQSNIHSTIQEALIDVKVINRID